jgi:hypothetical protein
MEFGLLTESASMRLGAATTAAEELAAAAAAAPLAGLRTRLLALVSVSVPEPPEAEPGGDAEE